MSNKREAFCYKFRGRLMVLSFDENQVPFIYSYDDGQVWFRNDGQIGCLKCINPTKYLWKASNRGVMFCEVCKEERGSFNQLGFAERIVIHDGK